MVSAALAAGITAADTHRATDPKQGYGWAQARLHPWARDFRITTKIYGRSDIPISEQLAITLTDLDIPSVHACFVHDWAVLSDDERRSTAQALAAVRASGEATKVGVSAYDEAEVNSAIEHFVSFDVVQVPARVVDQRLMNSAVLQALSGAGAEIQARSMYLQTLLLGPRATASLPEHQDIRRFPLLC